jgi:hypothetical protein
LAARCDDGGRGEPAALGDQAAEQLDHQRLDAARRLAGPAAGQPRQAQGAAKAAVDLRGADRPGPEFALDRRQRQDGEAMPVRHQADDVLQDVDLGGDLQANAKTRRLLVEGGPWCDASAHRSLDLH